jgi:hypothetical protein
VDRESRGGEPGAARLLARFERRVFAEPRAVPGERALRTTLRTAHIVAFSTLYGGHLYGVAPERMVPALIATLATGAAFACLEVYRTPSWLIQMRGLATAAKLALVTSVALFWDWRVLILTLVIAIGVVTSHMPGRYRYYSVLYGRIVDHGGKG